MAVQHAIFVLDHVELHLRKWQAIPHLSGRQLLHAERRTGAGVHGFVTPHQHYEGELFRAPVVGPHSVLEISAGTGI